jgi:hypothetical protein
MRSATRAYDLDRGDAEAWVSMYELVESSVGKTETMINGLVSKHRQRKRGS